MPTKADTKAVAAIFENGGDFDSSEAAAKAAIEALDARRRDRLTYAVVVNARPVPVIYNGFENREEGIRWAKRVGLDVADLDVWVLPMLNRDVVLDRHLKQDDEVAEKQVAATTKRKKR